MTNLEIEMRSEICRCGHLQIDHGIDMHEFEKSGIVVHGHGRCFDEECACPYYTFEKFVWEDEQETA